MILLFLDYVINNGQNDESFWWELIKAVLAGLTIVAGILFQRYRERKSRDKDKIVTLYLFNESIKSIVKTAKLSKPVFVLFSKQIVRHPFENVMLGTTHYNPDMLRIEKIDTKIVYEAFLLLYKDDKVKAAKYYRQCNNSILFVNEILTMLKTKYDTISQEIYLEKVKYSEHLSSLRASTTDELRILKNAIPNYATNPLYKAVNDTFADYLEQIDDLQPLEWHHNKFIVPMKQVLLTYQAEEFAIRLLKQIKVMENLKSKIVLDSGELGNLVERNIHHINEPLKKLDVLTKDIEGQLLQEMTPKIKQIFAKVI